MLASLPSTVCRLARHGSSFGASLLALLSIHLWQTKDFRTSGLANALTETKIILIQAGREPKPVFVNNLIQELSWQEPSRPLALHLWEEWCSICKIQESSLESLHKNHSVITVAVQSGGAEKVAQVLEDRNLSMQTLVDPSGQWLSALGSRAVPSFMIINKRNELSWVKVGYTT